MQKLVYCEESEINNVYAKKLNIKFGHTNFIPEPWTEITLDQFRHKYQLYNVEAINHHQCRLKKDGTPLTESEYHEIGGRMRATDLAKNPKIADMRGTFSWHPTVLAEAQASKPFDTKEEYDAAKRCTLGSVTPIKFYYFHDCVIAEVAWTYNSPSSYTPAKYFRIGCEHKSMRYPTQDDFNKGVPRPRNCYHISVCNDCGWVSAVDSSG
jgi:hypothetical protein